MKMLTSPRRLLQSPPRPLSFPLGFSSSPFLIGGERSAVGRGPAMVVNNFTGPGIGLGFGIGCGFGVGWGFGGMPLNMFGLGIGGGCGVGLGLGCGFGKAYGCQYRSSRVLLQGIEFQMDAPYNSH